MNNKQNYNDISLADTAKKPTNCGRYGMMRAAFLRMRYPEMYRIMQEDGTLKTHQCEVEAAANQRYKELCAALAEEMEKDTALKNSDRQAWYRRMDDLREEADRKVLQELVYT